MDIAGSFPNGFTVPAGETWEITPGATVTCGVAGNPASAVVLGTLKMRGFSNPATPTTLRFLGINESTFVGGGNVTLATDPLIESDPGLWVIGAGKLDVQGTTKVGWNRTGTDPSWLGGDEKFITPTAVGSFLCTAYTGGAVPQAYPAVPKAEVFNLTRDCIIEGQTGQRAHVYILSSQPQIIKYAEMRHLGPRTASGVFLGRWALHFHHGVDGSRGSVVTGCSLHDIGAYAYVAHDSNGVTFTDCVAFRVAGAGFWWDRGEPTDDIAWINCLAAEITKAGTSTGGVADDNNPTGFLMHSLAPHTLSAGALCRGCVAAAMGNQATSRGFFWQVGSTSDHWIFEDNVVHNTRLGMEWWANQIDNGTPPARTDRFTVYNNGTSSGDGFGIFQGAYGNPVRNDQAILRGNELRFHNSTAPAIPSGQVSGATGADVDVAGLRTRALLLDGSQVPSAIPHTFIECKFDGATAQAVEIAVNDRQRAWDFIRCTVDGTGLEFVDFLRANPGGHVQNYIVRVQRANGTAFKFTATTGPDVIAAFHSVAVTGTAAVTQANQTSTASGTVSVGATGTVAVTQANQTSDALGTFGNGIFGMAAVTQAAQTSTAAGMEAFIGTAAVTQKTQTSAASAFGGRTFTFTKTSVGYVKVGPDDDPPWD